jgi:hypothetical protein
MEAEVSLPCSQQPATDHYPEPDESNPHPATPFPYDPLKYHPPSGLFPSEFPAKILYAFLVGTAKETSGMFTCEDNS